MAHKSLYLSYILFVTSRIELKNYTMVEDYINNEIRDVLNDMDYDDAGFSSYDIENKQVSVYTDNKGAKRYKVKFDITIYQHE